MKKLLKKLNKRSDREESKPVKAENPSPGSSRAATLPRPEKFGLFPLHEPSPGANHRHRPFPINIIAVHGLSGDAYSTWTHPNGTLWLKDLLPDFLPGCRVYTYGYPSQVAFSTSYADVSVYARRLLNSIRGLLEEWAEGSRSIIFVCHSLGGIVFKQALVFAHEDDMAVLKSIAGVVFLGTPQRGSDMANIGAIAGRVINACAMAASAGLHNRIVRRDLLDNLSFDSKALQDLSISVRNRLLDMDVVSFYETKPLSPFSCLIVEQNSAILAIPGEDPVPLYEDHRSMCRFAGETESYRAVSQAIRRIALAVKDKTEARKEHPDERSSLHSSLRSFTDFERTCVALFSVFSTEDYRRSLRQPATGTCHWILRHPVFVTWLERADSALLWLSGYPGCGKTVLSLFLAGHFEAWQSPLAPKTVLIYFCDDRITRQKDANGILLGLIFQIICRHRSLIRHVKRAFETRGPNMVQSFSALWGVFLDAVSDPKCGTTHIIIDALDECEPDSRRKLLESIYSFLHDSGGGIGTKQRLKFILTSRPSTVELETIAGQVADHRISIDEDQEGYLDDLKQFIQRRVDEISQRWKLPPDTKTFLGKSLVSQAGETFLWAHMVLAWLESRLLLSNNAIRDLLTMIPPNLETTYLGLLSSIPPDHHSAASKLLLLVLGSSRPLSLEELNMAFTVQERHRTLEDVASDSQTAMQHTIQGVLGPLVRTSESKVSLVHKSVKDFLLQRRQMDNAPPVMRELTPISAALSISAACIRYLLLHDFSRDLFSSDDESTLESTTSFHGPAECCASSPTGSCSRQSSLDEDADEWGMAGLFKEPEVLLANACQLLAETYAFYRYASLNWTEHYAVCEASAPAELRDAATSLLDITTPHGGNWWRFFTADPEHKTRYDIPSRPSRLTLAAFFGLSDALNAELLHVGHQTELSRTTTDDALFWASYEGHSSIIETLLSAGADPNAQGLDGHTALTIASRNGHLGCVVALLREARTNFNLRGEKGRTALSLACSNQHPDIVQTLLATAHCNAAVQDDSGATALHWACRVAENNLARAALLRHGTVSPNHRDKHGRTALFWAAGHGIKTAVKALLDLPAVDANLADIHGRSPLLWAAGNGRASTVRLLVRSDKVDKASVDKDGRNSFSWAAGGGHADVLRVLVENGCPGVDEPDVDHWAPLAWATFHSSPRAADVLLATRAVDLERRDKGGWTALAWAVRYGHIHVVRSLLRAGADPLAASNSGATPLSLSQEPGRELLQDELLQYTKGQGRAEE